MPLLEWDSFAQGCAGSTPRAGREELSQSCQQCGKGTAGRKADALAAMSVLSLLSASNLICVDCI